MNFLQQTSGYKEMLNHVVTSTFEEYGVVIACLTIGIVIGWSTRWLIADRSYRKQINLRITERDEKIEELKFLVNERLRNIKVQPQDQSFFKNLKKFFKSVVANKK